MKTLNPVLLIFAGLLVLFFTMDAFAYDVPEDAVIKVYTKDGKQIGEMSRSEYKVVKLGTSEPAPKHHTPAEIKQMADAIDYEQKHNSIILHGGVGYDGLRVRNNGNQFDVRERQRPVFGATYCYTQTKTGVCASAFSNELMTLGIKRDF